MDRLAFARLLRRKATLQEARGPINLPPTEPLVQTAPLVFGSLEFYEEGHSFLVQPLVYLCGYTLLGFHVSEIGKKKAFT